MPQRFNVPAFYASLDAIREARGLTWKHVASQAQINASTLSRIGQGKKPDIDGLAALLVWSNLKAEMFIADSSHEPLEPIAQITSIIRMDRTLSHNSAKIVENIFKTAYNNLRSE